MAKAPKRPHAKKKNALAAAASRRLSRIGGDGSRYTPEQIAHFMVHAEERGEAERVTLEDGSWGWQMSGPDGRLQVLKPTPEMLAALDRFETEGHPTHEDE
ncbi:MAG: hypothetical protein ACLQVI_32320 [Polyangiaceae bacterium]